MPHVIHGITTNSFDMVDNSTIFQNNGFSNILAYVYNSTFSHLSIFLAIVGQMIRGPGNDLI